MTHYTSNAKTQINIINNLSEAEKSRINEMKQNATIEKAKPQKSKIEKRYPAMSLNCEKCGMALSENANFCSNCGFVPQNRRKKICKESIISFIISLPLLLLTVALFVYVFNQLNTPKHSADIAGAKLTSIIILVLNIPNIILAHVGLRTISSNIYLTGKGFSIFSLIIGYTFIVISLILSLIL